MRPRTLLATGAYLFVACVAVKLAAQGAPPAPPPAPAGAQQPAAPQGRGRGAATFPAQQRPPGDPVLIKKGNGIYDVYCRACHGADLRGGDQGGPNLLRSQVVLNDQSGELILPVVRNGRMNPGMPAMPPFPNLSDDDVKSVSEYIHSVTARARGQGAPPEGDPIVLNIVVGDAKAGEAYFQKTCTTCHTAKDMEGIATRTGDPMALQNYWVGGGGGRGGRGGAGGAATPVTAVVSLSTGDKVEGRLIRLDDFIVVVQPNEGMPRSFRRESGVVKVEVRDPREAHRKLLPLYTDKRHSRRDRLSGDTQMTFKKLTLMALAIALPLAAPLTGQSPSGSQAPRSEKVMLDPAEIKKPLADSGRPTRATTPGMRYSALTQVNQTTVKNLTLAWTARMQRRRSDGGCRRWARLWRTRWLRRFGGGATAPVIIGGEGTGEFPVGGATVKGAILQVNGVLYVTAPDNVWAIDARDGRELWRYFWKTKGGTHIGNRGVGMWNDYLFFETPDNYLVSLDARTGKEHWHVEIADFEQQYFSTMAPIVIDNHVLVGTGNDLDAPGFLQSYDPETGKRKWIFYTVPMKPGDPGLETWPSLEAARHGGGQVWVPGSYDPETKLYIFGTGNPTPGYTGAGRKGDNLFTCSLIAVNVDTGKMAWYFQTSPHDTHDWDSAQTPILIDATINGKPRKLVSTAARNGYFFTVDRVTGEHLVTAKYGIDDELGGSSSARPARSSRTRRRKRRFLARSCRRSKAA